MKRQIATSLAAGLIALGGYAAQPSDYLIFLNPGHGGHDSDDRNVVIAPYKQGDPEGYWESNSNLTKALWLRTMLEAKGYKVMMSRTTNTTADDLQLSTISRMANDAGADLFFSIHSNATGTSIRANFPLMLYRGWDNEADNAEDRVVATILNKHLLENKATYWTSSAMNVRGDWSFYNWGYKVGLGVLRGLTVTGMLSEGSFHDYIPETYRLMNEDFCRLEAWHFRRAVDEYFNQPGESVGQIGGRINDSRLPREGEYIIHGEDKFATVQNATVELYDEAGTLVSTYTTSPVLINGFYAFRDVAPGKYHLKISAPTHYPNEADIEVMADAITYCNVKLDRIRDTPPAVKSYSPVYAEGDEPLLCNTPVSVTFTWDMNTEATERAFSINPPVKGTFSWSDLNYTMTFTPSEPMEINTLYTVNVSTEACHAGGMKLEQPLQFSFLTTSRNFMEVTRQWPTEGAEVHYSGAIVELRLDRKPDGGNLTKQISVVDSKGNPVEMRITGKKTSTSRDRYGFLRMPFLGDLTPGETYTVTFDGSIADRDGITLKEPVVATFRAVDAARDLEHPTIADITDASAWTLNETASTDIKKSTVAADTKTVLKGDRSLALTYEFNSTSGGVASWSRAASDEDYILTIKLNHMDVLVYGDLSGNDLYLELTDAVSTKYTHLCKLDFHGWRLITVQNNDDALHARITGVRIEQTEADNSVLGTVYLSPVMGTETVGITDISADDAGISIYPNPASEYIIANADFLIDGIELISMNGSTVAKADGNILNVSEVAPGTYLCRITASGTSTIKRVIVK